MDASKFVTHLLFDILVYDNLAIKPLFESVTLLPKLLNLLVNQFHLLKSQLRVFLHIRYILLLDFSKLIMLTLDHLDLFFIFLSNFKLLLLAHFEGTLHFLAVVLDVLF